jgi:hypothetical protein
LTVFFIKVIADGRVIAVTGDRCGKWAASLITDSSTAAALSSNKKDGQKPELAESDVDESEEIEVELYKVDPEKEKKVMKELKELEEHGEEELDESDQDEKEDSVYV